ncbi:MAG TPA: hypothetical protein VH593_03885 [Ktedonobacteraceae bacterium]
MAWQKKPFLVPRYALAAYEDFMMKNVPRVAVALTPGIAWNGAFT